MRRESFTRAAMSVMLAVLMSSAGLAIAGCGGGGDVHYRLRRSGRTLGGDAVRRESGDGVLTYSSTERRPYEELNTTYERQVVVSSDFKTLESYDAARSVPGATFSILVKKEGDSYEYLDDRIQTFCYTQGLRPTPGYSGFLPFEPDSACLVQLLLDKFEAADVGDAVTMVMVPSLGPDLREAFLQSHGEREVSIELEGFPKLEVELDEDGELLEVTGIGENGIMTRGSAGSLDSRPYAPREPAIRVKEVRVPTVSDEVELAGSLYLPSGKKPYPAVVLTGDYGPQNRTGGGLLSQIATRLAREGMAVLSCDRRGVPDSDGNYATYTLESALADLNSQVEYLVLRGDVDIERIGVLGHGEGGQVASYVASVNPYVVACVLLAAPAVSAFPELRKLQIEGALTRGDISEYCANSALENLDRLLYLVNNIEGDYVQLDGRELFLGWMRSNTNTDIGSALGGLKIPFLVVQGGMDEEVPPQQAQDLMGLLEAREAGEQELAFYDDLGHWFGPRVVEPPYQSRPALDGRVEDRIVDWLGREVVERDVESVQEE